MQDFSKKMAIVVDKNLQSWQVLNCVAHIVAYLGNKMKDKFDTGDYFETKDGKLHPRNSQYPIIVFSADDSQLKNLMNDIRQSGFLYIGFIKEMIEINDDEEIVKILSGRKDSEVEYLGIGVFGHNEPVKTLTKKFSLWR